MAETLLIVFIVLILLGMPIGIALAAGAFYLAESRALAREVDRLLAEVPLAERAHA